MTYPHKNIPLVAFAATLLVSAPVLAASDDPTKSPAVNMQNGTEAQPSAPTQPAAQSNATPGNLTGSITPANAQAAAVLAKLQYANKMEISMGTLAETKAKSRDVKAFAKQVTQDHQTSLDKVNSLAKAQQIDIAAAANGAADRQKDEQNMATLESLKSKKGSAFDKAFLEQMVTDHKNNIEMLRGAQASLTTATTPDVSGLIAATLPVLEQHQKRATELLQKITGSTQPS